MATTQLLQSQGNQRKPLDVFDVLQFWPLVPVLPVVGALAHLIARPRAWSPTKKSVLAAAGVAAGLNLVRWQLERFTLARPRYEVLSREGRFEVRRYPALVVAQTRVNADFDTALDEGFSRLAGFIFGNNMQHERVAMTAPVMTHPEKLQMTTPVTAQPEDGAGYTVTFMMPPERTVADLPLPEDDRVTLREWKPRTVACLQFRGRYDAAHVARACQELLTTTRTHHLKVRGAPAFAGYDAPAVLPFLRRNEVWAEVADED